MTGRWTVCCSLFILISTSFSASTFAQKQIDDEARSVTADCHEALKRTGQLQTFGAGMCLGILKGLHYLTKNICIPPAPVSAKSAMLFPNTSIAIRARLTTISRKLPWTRCVRRGHAPGEITFS
jgi:hypothetical protein